MERETCCNHRIANVWYRLRNAILKRQQTTHQPSSARNRKPICQRLNLGSSLCAPDIRDHLVISNVTQLRRPISSTPTGPCSEPGITASTKRRSRKGADDHLQSIPPCGRSPLDVRATFSAFLYLPRVVVPFALSDVTRRDEAQCCSELTCCPEMNCGRASRYPPSLFIDGGCVHIWLRSQNVFQRAIY